MSRVTRTRVDYAELIQPDRVHGSLYHDPAVFTDEMDRIFHRQWVFVGHESELKNIGDFCRRRIGARSVILLRDANGEIQIFYDRCPHRGNRLSPTPQGNARGFICPYHGWAFNLCGELTNAPWPERFGPEFDPKQFGLTKVARSESYAGFIFASLSPEGPTLSDHLGATAGLIDTLNGLSPEGKIRIDTGWMKHRIYGNWKGVFENHLDGYHPTFAHRSLVRAKDTFAGQRDRRVNSAARTIDYGNGHGEVDLAADFRGRGITMGWSGISPDLVPEYVSAMHEAYGEVEAARRLIDGPAHAAIFPNLLLAELNLMILEPVSADEVIVHTSPVLFAGGRELNERNLRRCEGALGPAGMIFADDAEIADLCQHGMLNDFPEWAVLRRGLHSEEVTPEGTRVGGFTDETPQRGFWRNYRQEMEV